MIRRDFIKNAGCLTIGFMMGKPITAAVMNIGPLAEDLPQSLKRHPAIDAWLQIRADGSVLVYTGKMELGQGIRTAICQVAADELDLRMNQVEVKLAETGVTPDEGYTAGSGSMDNSAMSVRYAAAAARAKLLEMAAVSLKTPIAKLSINEGSIVSTTTKKKISFGDLLEGKQLTEKVALPVNLKPKAQYKFVGKAIPRDDIRQMIQAKPVYLQDLRFPGMVHARILRPANYAATLDSFDEKALRIQFPTLLKAVVDGSFVGVITESEYTSVQIQSVGQSFVRWNTDKPLVPQGIPALRTWLKTLPTKSESVRSAGSVQFSSGKVHSASYFRPYTMHGSVGPSCSIALYDKGVLHIWSHSQGVYPLRNTLQKMLDIPLDKIHITGVPGSGCYGHNGADDVSAEAAILAINYPGKHVRLQWSRADEHAWEPYGSAMIMDIKARLNDKGLITDWQYDLWSDTHSTRPGGKPENLLPAKYIRKSHKGTPGGYSAGAYRNSEPYYTIANQKIDVHFFEGPLRVSALRSLGAYGNVFAIESFMDELADKAGLDPYEFRLMHLTDPRAKAVLTKLRGLVDKQPKIEGAGTGIAFSRYKNTAAYCAVAATISFSKEKDQFIIHKMFSVIDAGEAINTDGLINQTEGGMIQAASWTMQEEVKFNHEAILSVDWKSYPIFRFSQVPETEVIVIDNPENGPMGAGEAAQGPAGAAVANAIARTTGKRYRDLPITPMPLPES